jgi:hypothetical protein
MSASVAIDHLALQGLEQVYTIHTYIQERRRSEGCVINSLQVFITHKTRHDRFIRIPTPVESLRWLCTKGLDIHKTPVRWSKRPHRWAEAFRYNLLVVRYWSSVCLGKDVGVGEPVGRRWSTGIFVWYAR